MCVRANIFKLFLDGGKFQLNYPRFLRSLSKNPRFRLGLKLTQINELSKNQSSSVSTPKTNSVQNNKDLTTSELLRRDLKNYARSEYNLVIDNVPVFVGEFNKMYPGFVNSLGLQAILYNAEILTREFMTDDNENGCNSHNSHTTLTHNMRDEEAREIREIKEVERESKESEKVPVRSNLLVTAEEMAKAWEEEGI